MNAKFRLKDGWELHARTAPEAFGKYGPALREIVLWGPQPDPAKDAPGEMALRTGQSYSGDSWRECFRRLREDQEKHGWLDAKLVPRDDGGGSELQVHAVDLSARDVPFTATYIGVAESRDTGELGPELAEAPER